MIILAKEWLILIECSKKRTTYMKYCSVYEKYIKKKLGPLPFSKLNEETLAEVFRKKENQNKNTRIH